MHAVMLMILAVKCSKFLRVPVIKWSMFVQLWLDSVRNGILTSAPTLQYARWMGRTVRQKLATLTSWVATKLHRAVSLSKFLTTHFLQSCATGKWMETSFVSYMTALTQVRPANTVHAKVTSFRYRYRRQIKKTFLLSVWVKMFLTSVNIWQSYKQECDCLVHFARLACCCCCCWNPSSSTMTLHCY